MSALRKSGDRLVKGLRRWGDRLLEVALTVAAWAWVHRRALVEHAGLGFLAAAGYVVGLPLGLFITGLALILSATFTRSG